MSLAFWILAGLLVAAAAAMLAIPLRRASRAPEPEADPAGTSALDVLRDQRRELDREVAAGRMTDAEREQRIAELSRRVVEEGLATPAASVASAPSKSAARPMFAIAIALLVPAVALPLYWLLGTPEALDPALRAPAAAAPHAGVDSEQFRTLLADLRKRLDANPGDANGWQMLGRGLRAVDDLPGSAEAFAKAAALLPEDASALLEYAEALAMSRNRDLTGEPYELIKRALQLSPRLPKALAMAGAAEFAQGRFEAARTHWTNLLAVLPAESQEAGELKQMLAQLDSHAGVAGGKGTGNAAGAQQPAAVASAPTSPMQAQAGTGAAGPAAPKSASGSADKAVSGTVRVAPGLAGKAGPDDTLFIYARAAVGPRMPLAIVKMKARDLPFAFRLDDSQAMAGGPSLSSASQVRIEARVSKSGQAMPQSGDLRGESAPVTPGASNLEIVIDKVVD